MSTLVDRVKVAEDAQMAFPTTNLCHQMRYCVGHNYPAAESLESYRYLVLECTQKEAWRRIKLIREAVTQPAPHKENG